MINKFLFLFPILILFNVQAQNVNLFIGTYTNKCESKGIYFYNFNANTGDFNLISTTENVVNPSFMSLSKDQKRLYAVNENGDKSTVSSFEVSLEDRKLNFINKKQAQGADPCYLINDAKNVIVANYTGGSISVFGKNSDGGISEVKQVVQHLGKGFNPNRQGEPHVHMVCFSPDHNFVLVNDLGLDSIFVYKYDPNSTYEVLKLKERISVDAGTGPRHLAFGKGGDFVYLLQEINGALTVFRYKNGFLKKIEETTILSKEFKGGIGSADIHVSPDGKFLYATNRGDANDISVFEILKNGKLKSKGQIDTLGKGPRNFAIDPSGNFLLVAEQYTNEVVIFKRDKTTGYLTDTGKRIALCAPVCLVFGK
jgi:6-phosphogluconolactonase